MNADDPRRPDLRSPTRAGRIDEACDRFEAAWKGGRSSRIEDHLIAEGATGPERSILFRELLALELELRRGRGERPAPLEYRARFPAHSTLIDEVFLAAGSPVEPRTTTPDPGRELLFGLLALQNNFIDRSELISAFADRDADRSRPLGRILLDRGALDPPRHALLEALVVEHLRLGDGDPQKSLDALELLGPIRRDLEAMTTDPALKTGPTRVVKPGKERSAPNAAASHPGRPATADSRFRVLRPHAKGGLGEVFVAEDAELNREVALKEIQTRHVHDPHIRARFVQEAQITGGLEHPGIVPVYGMGAYPDGRPFYAMRLVKGDSYKEAVERFYASEAPGRDPSERALAFRGLLGRFVAACNAVAYAHSRGVIHRDIKPANIMLGPFGETLVVDWGLAKSIGRPEVVEETAETTIRPRSGPGSTPAPTLAGSALGTPAYMSPEQAVGDLNRIGPRSDVYSLGATLYCTLTGRAPFTDPDVGAVLRRVERGDFPPPRAIQRATPPALEAICRRAMALRPEDRYGSPRELADELEHWLADEPVDAYREPWHVRLGRWSRRHLPLVAGAAGLLLATAVGLAAGAALLGRANRRISDEWTRAETNFLEARAQRDRAETNFEMARDAVDRFFTRVSEDRLLNEPHLSRVRRDLLVTAREFHQRFVTERAGDPRALADLGKAYLRLSRIASLLAELPKARSQAEEAREIFTGLSAAHPDNADHRYELARSHTQLGYLDVVAGRASEAETSLKRAREIQESLIRENPESVDYRHELAAIHNRLGSLYRDTGRIPEAEATLKESLKIQETLSREHPEDPVQLRELAAGNLNLGLLYQNLGRAADAETIYRRAMEFWGKLADAHPEVADNRRYLAWTFNNLANLYGDTARPDRAEAAHIRAREIRRTLVSDHPEVASYRGDLAASYNNLGIYYLDNGRVEESEESYVEAAKIWDRMAVDYPEELNYVVQKGGIEGNLGNLMKIKGDFARACDWYGKSISTLEGVLRKAPDQVIARFYLRNAYWEGSEALGRLGRHKEALAHLELALKFDDRRQGDKIRLFRALALARSGDFKRALAEAEALADLATIDPATRFYDLARIDALASAASRDDPELSPDDRARKAESFASRAVERLDRASRSEGFVPLQVVLMDADPAFDPIRSRGDFRALMMDIKFPKDPFTR